jgi:hypothetical protein
MKNNLKNLFIGYVKPKEQKDQKQENIFFDALIRNVCNSAKTKTFKEIFDSVCFELPEGFVGFTNTPDFNFQLRFCEEEGWSYLSVLILLVLLVFLVLLVLLI